MTSFLKRSKFTFCFAMLLLSLGLSFSCKTATPDPYPRGEVTRPDPREELIRSLKGANVDGYYFATTEDDTATTASLTNSAVRKLVRLDKGDSTLPLRYTSVKDRKTNAAKTYKTELVKTGATINILVTDFATGEVVDKNPFLVVDPHPGGTHPTFDTLEDCIKDFNCTKRGAIQCEADRTCKDQFVGITCCLKDGTCFSVHLLIRPTSLKCQFQHWLPDLEGFVLTR